MTSSPPSRSPIPSAVLLLGPTGVGKTPLGDLIAGRGLWGSRFVHFDFGDNLRRIVRRNRPNDLIGPSELDFLRRVLESGALLENEHFYIAERVLRSFQAERDPDGLARILLNGLPRHVDQAEDVGKIVRIECVISLHSPSHTILERIRGNVGGDRTGRVDDDLESVRARLAVFARRTAPLVDYYRENGAGIETLEVTAAMTPEDAWGVLNERRQP